MHFLILLRVRTNAQSHFTLNSVSTSTTNYIQITFKIHAIFASNRCVCVCVCLRASTLKALSACIIFDVEKHINDAVLKTCYFLPILFIATL